MAEIDHSQLAPAVDEYLKQMHPVIKRKLLYNGESAQYLTAIPAAHDGDYEIVSARNTEMFQQFATEFTKKGKLEYTGDKIAIQRGKVDYAYSPQNYYDLLIQEIAKMASENEIEGQPVNWEFLFSQNPLDAYVAKQLVSGVLEDIEKITLWNGQYKAPQAGVAGRAKYVVDGLYTMLKKHVKSGRIVPVLAGTFTDNTLVDFIDDFLDQIDELYQNVAMPMMMSHKLQRLYRRKYAGDFADSAQERRGIMNERRTLLEGSGCYTQGAFGLSGKNILIATPTTNMAKVVSPNTNAQVQANRREHEFLMDIGFGLDFLYKEIVFVAGEMIEAPTLRPVTSIATTSAVINIEEVAEATGYEVERATNPDFTGSTVVQFASPSATLTNITLDDTPTYVYNCSQALTGLTTGTTYYYRVRAKMLSVTGTTYVSGNSKVGTFTTL